MPKKLIGSVALLMLFTGAEVFASGCIWSEAPTDTLRVLYAGFWHFESGRLPYWIPVLISSGLLWGVCWYGLRLGRHRAFAWIFGGGLAAATEISTSALYWRSAASEYVRNLYESGWYWHRVPQANDLGLPSFRGYLWSHLVPWAVVLLLGLVTWHLWHKRKKSGLSHEAGYVRGASAP